MTTFKNDQQRQCHKFWEHHLTQWKDFGLCQAEYCRRNNVKIKSFIYWKAKLTTVDRPMELIQVPQTVGSTSQVLKLHLGRGVHLEIPDGFSTVTFEKLLKTLRVLS